MAQPLHMEAEFLELRTKHPFIIARGGQSDYRTIWVRLRDADGHVGWGEAAPSRFYGETAETVLSALNVYVGGHADRSVRPRGDRAALGPRCCGSTPSARAALSAALHDLVGKRLGVPVYRLWGLDPAKAPRSTFTIGLDTPERIRLKVEEAARVSRSSR